MTIVNSYVELKCGNFGGWPSNLPGYGAGLPHGKGGPQTTVHHAHAEVLYDRAKMYLAL